MRIASFNVENLFDRAKALNGANWEAGRPVLAAHARLNTLLEKPRYTPEVKRQILGQLDVLGLTRSDTGPLALLRQIRGRLVKRGRAGVEVVAEGRGDWIGWVELRTERVDEKATAHTARAVTDVDPDLMGVVEADNRVALQRFSHGGLLDGSRLRYPHVMLIDGNDDRGIDVGLLTREPYWIETMRSHVDDVDDAGPVFSRDCAEYEVSTPGGNRLLLMLNHFKSKGYGGQRASDAKRRRQAVRVAELYEARRAQGFEYIAVLGDFNDTPDSGPLAPLLADTDVRDISKHPAFDDGGRPGTYGNSTKSSKIDYVLLSPALFGLATGGGVFRKGVWGGKNGTLWPIYETMTSPVHAASDHAVIFADVNLT